MTAESVGGPLEQPNRGSRVWEAGWIGSPRKAAAALRGFVVLVFTLIGIAAVAVQWSHATYAAAFAVLDLVPVVLIVSIGMVALLYWVHGSLGQLFLFFFAALLSALVGGVALSNAIFAARGVVSSATVTERNEHSDLRTTYNACQVTLADGNRLPRPIRCDSQRIGQRTTVTYDPAGLAAPAFGDRTRPDLALLVTTGVGLLLTTGSIAAATWHGERQRLRGRPSLAETHNPHYYPRRRAGRDRSGRA